MRQGIATRTMPDLLVVFISRAKMESNLATTRTKPVQPVVRTSAGLRDIIFDEIDSIRDGTSNPTRANAVAKLAAGVVETVRMEIEVQRHLKANKNEFVASASLGEPLVLGR